MISQMFINVNAIVIILLNIYKKYKKIKNDALDNGNIISLKKNRIIYKIIFLKFFIEKGINIRYNNTIII